MPSPKKASIAKETYKCFKKSLTPKDAVQLIRRFLQEESLYPQEWNDFVDTPQDEVTIEVFRRRCYELDPLVNQPGDPDPEAVAELRSMIANLFHA